MKHNWKLQLAAGVAAALLTTAVPARAHGAGEMESGNDQLHYGRAMTLGGGSVRTYVTVAKEKDAASNRRPPVAIGVEIPQGVLYSLPENDTAIVADFPIQARNTPFQYMMLDWNAHGHPPAGVYDRPHFDFHFYMQDLQDVMAIRPGPCSELNCEDFQRAMKPLPAQYQPEGYINVGSTVPFMGNHLIDPTSPEFSGKPFTRTFLYGMYDGNVTFYEPMITLESLMMQTSQCSSFKLPQQYAETGYYPTKYCTEYDKDKKIYRMFVTDFVYRVAPQATTVAQH